MRERVQINFQPHPFERHVQASKHAAMGSSPGYPGMERWRGKVALVTGASAGIGYTTAKQLTELGMNVVGCARNISTIEVNTYTSLPSGYWYCFRVSKCLLINHNCRVAS